MNKVEKRILSATIKKVIRGNQHTWLVLKREIFDCGYQVRYETTCEFSTPVERALKSLSSSEIEELNKQWMIRSHGQIDNLEQNMFTDYALQILDEIVDRARKASNKTSEWY